MGSSAAHDGRYDGFRSFCAQVNRHNVHTFRSNMYFRQIVENVSAKLGGEYYDLIVSLYGERCEGMNWRDFEKVMSIGSPMVTQAYRFGGSEYRLSPCVLRYLKFTFDMLSHVAERTPLKELDVVEIGGGYGCQAVLLRAFAAQFGLVVRSYTIVDLPEVNNMQRTYIDACCPSMGISLADSPIACVTADEYVERGARPNFVISNYALGEFNTYWQDFYVENVVKKTSHAYFCWNFSPANPTIHEYFATVDDLIKEEESPPTNTPPVVSYVIRY